MNSIYISAAGIGVSDLAAAKAFYVDIVGLEHRSQRETSLGKEEVLVDARGNTLLLTNYAHTQNCKNSPVKVVFAVPDVDAFYARVLAGGGRKLSAPQHFGGMYLALAYDLEGYVVEYIQVASAPGPVLIAVGIGVSDLDAAADHYTRVLGMQFVRDIAVPGYMNEKELAPSKKRGPSLVLMHYEDKTRRYEDIPTRLVLTVDDAAALTEAVKREDPRKVLQTYEPRQDQPFSYGILRDHDGYLAELDQPAGAVSV